MIELHSLIEQKRKVNMQDYEKDRKVPSHKSNQLEYNNLTCKLIKRVSKYNKIHLDSAVTANNIPLYVVRLGLQR